ncbi:serine hydrolase domain-containing protein [Pedobacter sp.]|uniref:serine hydrolase domain-containing protein n=1 Tax=Pedobacter sp. TaxID=1411316 RepID=UPI0031D0B337
MNKIFLPVILIFFALSTFTVSHAQQQSDSLRLDSLFSSIASYGQLNGNVLVAQMGRPIYQRSFGFADYTRKIPNAPSSGFTLASISKLFTSTAILQLAERGKLKLDEPVGNHLTGFPFQGITIRHLLSHTSALPDYDLFDAQLKNDTSKVFTNADVIPALIDWKNPLGFAPGAKWQYSNINYCLLALIVEKCSGIPFRAYIERNIFKAAGMEHTYFADKGNKIDIRNKTVNHDYKDMFALNVEDVEGIDRFRWRLHHMNGLEGQGNVVSTTSDMLRFDQALYTGLLLNASSLLLAFTPTQLSDGSLANASIGLGKATFGLGWFILDDQRHGKIAFHTGGVPGAVTILLRNVDRRQTVMVFDNQFSVGVYKNGLNALRILNREKPVVVRQSVVRAFAKALMEKDIDAAFVKLMELKADSTHYTLSEDDLNDFGLRLLYQAKFPAHEQFSLEVLRMNIIFFPSGFNTYDSYAEALAYLGRKQDAIMMYRRSLALNPNNLSGASALKKLLEQL